MLQCKSMKHWTITTKCKPCFDNNYFLLFLPSNFCAFQFPPTYCYQFNLSKVYLTEHKLILSVKTFCVSLSVYIIQNSFMAFNILFVIFQDGEVWMKSLKISNSVMHSILQSNNISCVYMWTSIHIINISQPRLHFLPYLPFYLSYVSPINLLDVYSAS